MLTLQEMTDRTLEAHDLLNGYVARSLAPTKESRAGILLANEHEWSAPPGSVEPVKYMLSYARAYLGAALDYLQGAAAATESLAAFDVDSLARSAIEAAAYAERLTDPLLTDSERMRRAFVDQVWSLREIRKLSFEEGTSEWVERTDRIEELLRAGKATCLASGDSTSRKVADSRARATDAIQELFEKGWSEGSEDTGTAIYRRLSGIAHSNPVLLINQSAKASTVKDRATVAIFAPSTKRYSISLLGATMAVSMASQSFGALHGTEMPIERIREILGELWNAVRETHVG